MKILNIEYEDWLKVYKCKEPFELYKKNEDYQVGENVILAVTNYPRAPKDFGAIPVNCIYSIIYISKDCPHNGLDKDYCILGSEKLNY